MNNGGLHQIGAFGAHQGAKLMAYGVAGGVLTQKQASHGSSDEQHRSNGGDGIKGDCRPPRQGIVFNKAGKAFLQQPPGMDMLEGNPAFAPQSSWQKAQRRRDGNARILAAFRSLFATANAFDAFGTQGARCMSLVQHMETVTWPGLSGNG